MPRTKDATPSSLARASSSAVFSGEVCQLYNSSSAREMTLAPVLMHRCIGSYMSSM